MLLYSLDPECALAAALSVQLDQPLAKHEERRFEDGECKLRPLSDPRGEDAYVLLGLHGGPVDSPHDKLWRLLMFIATLREHGASRVTALLPYLAYARKDQRTKPFDPVSLRYVAQMFEAVGTDQVIALEVHNVAAFQNAFRCTTVHLDAHAAFDKVLDFNLGMLERVVRRAQERGLAVVIVELPWNHEIIGDRFDESMARYRQPTQAIAARYDVPYLDFNARADIPSEDFLDLSHLLPAGRAVWEPELARELARLYDEGALPVEKP